MIYFYIFLFIDSFIVLRFKHEPQWLRQLGNHASCTCMTINLIDLILIWLGIWLELKSLMTVDNKSAKNQKVITFSRLQIYRVLTPPPTTSPLSSHSPPRAHAPLISSNNCNLRAGLAITGRPSILGILTGSAQSCWVGREWIKEFEA